MQETLRKDAAAQQKQLEAGKRQLLATAKEQAAVEAAVESARREQQQTQASADAARKALQTAEEVCADT